MDTALVNFGGDTSEVVARRYSSGFGLALVPVDVATGQQMAVATLNVPGASLAAGEVIFETYAENEGILEALVEAGADFLEQRLAQG